MLSKLATSKVLHDGALVTADIEEARRRDGIAETRRGPGGVVGRGDGTQALDGHLAKRGMGLDVDALGRANDGECRV